MGQKSVKYCHLLMSMDVHVPGSFHSQWASFPSNTYGVTLLNSSACEEDTLAAASLVQIMNNKLNFSI